jgi:magnesium transporter
MLLDAMVDRFLPTLDKIGETIDGVEESILEQMDPACLPKSFQLKRNLVHFRRAAVAQRELLNTLWRHESGIVPKDLAPYFRDVYDHVVTAIEMIESYRDLISGLLEIYLTQTANRTNQIVKAITIIATIILPLTLITGWYGMNVVNLPFAEDPLGLWYITAGLILVTLGFLVFFRRKGWL